MNISVFGIGYVGVVSAACLASEGHFVIAVDINSDKVASLNRGQAPIREPGLDELISTNVAAGRLMATTDASGAINQTDLSIVCVGTPSLSNGDIDRGDVIRVCEHIGGMIGRKEQYHLVVLRSTLLPGSTRDILIPIIEQSSSKQAGKHFGVAYYPEFLREGSAIHDFQEPEVVVLGVDDEQDAETLRNLVGGVSARIFVTDYSTAEAAKYANNTWHATKIVYANEIGTFCKKIGIDSRQVMEILCSDKKLNISPAYLRPGFAFGGSCLPKDLRALRYAAKSCDVALPMLEAIEESNARQIRRAFEMVCAAGHRRVGLIGLSFKSGTDDLRESPAVELAKLLYGDGYQLRIYDIDVTMSKLTGRNLSFVQSNLPHLDALLTDDMAEVVEFGDTLVAATSIRSAQFPPLRRGQVLIDLVGLNADVHPTGGSYQGFCW